MSYDSQEAPGFNVTVTLSPIAIEVLEQLFINGPTWDGDVEIERLRAALAYIRDGQLIQGMTPALFAEKVLLAPAPEPRDG